MTNEQLLAAINRRFDENDRRWQENAQRWQENDRRFEESRRHVDVRFEAVDHNFERLVEAIALVDEKLERFRDETNRRFDQLMPLA